MQRSIYFTFMNGNTPFNFRVDKMTRHPFKSRGATMLQTHALLTIDAKKSGRPMDLLDNRGEALGEKDLIECSRTGRIPDGYWT